MVKEGWTQIIVKDDLAARLRARLEEEHRLARRKPELSTYVQDLLWDVLERDEILRRYGPFMEYREAYDSRIRLQDNRSHELVEVQARDGKLVCLKDHREDCVHVGFCFAIPEVYKVLAEHGLKAPKVK